MIRLALLGTLLLGCDPEEGRPGGEPCAMDVQCAHDLCTPATAEGRATGFANGMCTQPCDAGGLPCLDAGFQCVVFSTGGLCLPECDRDDDCRDGYVCATVGAASPVCFPDCRSGLQCLTGLCDATTGQCVPPGDAWEDAVVPEDAPATGAPDDAGGLLPTCSADGTCDDGGVCAGPHRTCHARCGLGEPACPPRTGCGPTPLGPLCLPLCDDESPCPTGMYCAPSPIPPPPGEGRPLVCLKSGGGMASEAPAETIP
ncbi:MAG: hypothetical protein IV100_10285 [Myxococcales bacterium]|nr:hypothetical protein [Myxococcales bacterium]